VQNVRNDLLPHIVYIGTLIVDPTAGIPFPRLPCIAPFPQLLDPPPVFVVCMNQPVSQSIVCRRVSLNVCSTVDV